ncbi:MAG: ATP-binding protein [Candidatus Margulisiibacteriota bacterium]
MAGSSAIGFIPSFTTFPLVYGIPVFPFGVPLMALYPFALYVAIFKHRFLDVRLLINKFLALILAISTFILFYLFIAFQYINFFLSSFYGFLLLCLTVVVIAFSGLFFNRIRIFFQNTADRAFIRGWYDFEGAVAGLSEKLSPVTQRDVLYQTIGSFLKDKLEVDNIVLLLKEKFPEKDPFRIYLSQANRPAVSRGEVRDVLKNSSFDAGQYYLPIYSPAGIDALFVLGEKASQDKYTNTDHNLFEFIQNQAVIILDRIRPYEELRKDFEANQKKLYDTERMLARSEKIASMAGLIQEYNHEIKTPLAIIKGEIEDLPEKQRDLDYLKESAKLMMKHVNRIDDIVESTLRLSKPKERKEEKLSLNDIIEEALKLFPPGGVHLVKELGAIPPVMGDREDLQTVFINLIKNAVEAMPDGGDLRITTYADKNNEGLPVVCAEVSDSGAGIPEKNMEKIFEPFFSTHVTKGRGLGLSITFRIIREHLGKIDVKNKPGKGACFIVQLRAMQP